MVVRSRPGRQVGREQLEGFVEGIFDEGIHAKRVVSLIDGIDGVLHAATLGIRAIGQGLAAAQGLVRLRLGATLMPRHAIPLFSLRTGKQVDRLLSNTALGRQSLFRCWVGFVVAERAEIVVNFDWTELEDSGQSMVVLGMQTRAKQE